jgi:hypothetical protein
MGNVQSRSDDDPLQSQSPEKSKHRSRDDLLSISFADFNSRQQSAIRDLASLVNSWRDVPDNASSIEQLKKTYT